MLEHLRAELVDWLGEEAVDFVLGLHETALRERTIAALELCTNTLEVVDQLEATERQVVQAKDDDPSVWEEIAPSLRNVVVAVRTTLEGMAELFPESAPDEDSDLNFDFQIVDGEVFLAQRKDRSALAIDGMVDSARSSDVPTAISSLNQILTKELLSFKERLRSPQVIQDHWFLASEVQEFRTKSCKCLEAIIKTALRGTGFIGEQSLPLRFRPETYRSAKIRTTVVNMLQRLQGSLDALRHTPERSEQIHEELLTDFDNLRTSPVYRWIRIHDKQALSSANSSLLDWDPGSAENDLFVLVERISESLSTMMGVNNRWELRHHDRQQLEAAKLMLNAGLGVKAVVPHLSRTYGRSAELDDWLRAYENNETPQLDALATLIDSALAETPQPSGG